jgi:hypothetical protein
MPIPLSALKLYGSATMADDDSVQQIGGAIDKAKKVVFADHNGSMQVVSSNVADTTQTVTMYYRDAAGNLLNEAKTLSGQTPVAFTATPERLMKAVKSASCAGDVALEAATAERSGTAQGGANTTITLDAGASATDQAYRGMVLRLTSGTGNGQIREVIDYNGTTKVATVNAAWATNPDATSVFRIAKGMFFDKTPNEVTQVRRLFYNAGANPPGGATKKYYDKVFFWNDDATLDLTSAQVIESADPSGLVAFGLEATLGGTTTNGAGNNRQVAPAGITFDSAAKNVANSGSLTHGAGQAVWLELTLAGGAAALKSTYAPQLQGNTV